MRISDWSSDVCSSDLDTYPTMSIDDGYAVQDALLARWREDGRVLVGLKAGLTSQAKMDQMGVTEPSFGMLMGDTLDPDGGIVPTDKQSGRASCRERVCKYG